MVAVAAMFSGRMGNGYAGAVAVLTAGGGDSGRPFFGLIFAASWAVAAVTRHESSISVNGYRMRFTKETGW